MEIKLNILYLVNVPSPYRVAFFNELGKLCNLTVLFERKFSSERNIDWHNYEFINFNGIYLNGVSFQADKGINPGVIKYLNEKLYDHIIIGGFSTPTGMITAIYLNLKKIPFILNIDGGMKKTKESILKRLIKNYFISSAYGWLSTGEVGSNFLEYYGAIRERIYIYPFTSLYTIDIISKIIELDEKIRVRKKMNIVGENIIISVGRFIESKGFDTLIKAWENVCKDSSLYIIGGTPTEEYSSLKNSLGLKNIHFLDFMEKEELKNYYKAADLFVLPTRGDAWGLVINEAMSYGLPVITTDRCVAGMELIKDYENGFIIPVDDQEMLSNRINEILNNQIMMKTMSQNNLEKISKYTFENMAAVTMRIIEDINERIQNGR